MGLDRMGLGYRRDSDCHLVVDLWGLCRYLRPSATHANLVLNYIVPSTSRGSGIAIGSSDGPFLQQPHQLAHGVRDHHLRVAFHKDVQLRVLSSLGLLAGAVEAAFRGDGCSRRFEDFGDVGAVRDGPAGFF